MKLPICQYPTAAGCGSCAQPVKTNFNSLWNALDGKLDMDNMSPSMFGAGLSIQKGGGQPTQLVNVLGNDTQPSYIDPKSFGTAGMNMVIPAVNASVCITANDAPTSQVMSMSVQSPKTSANPSATINAPQGNLNLTAKNNVAVADNKMMVISSADSTKQAVFSAGSISTGTKITMTIPNKNGTIAYTSDVAALLPINLAGGSSIVTGILPYTNLPTSIMRKDTFNTFSAGLGAGLHVGGPSDQILQIGKTNQGIILYANDGSLEALTYANLSRTGFTFRTDNFFIAQNTGSAAGNGVQLDTSLLTTVSNRLQKFPNKNGTFAMTVDVITDHTLLSNIGINTHAQIDTFISSATATPTVSAIPIADGSGTLNSWITGLRLSSALHLKIKIKDSVATEDYNVTTDDTVIFASVDASHTLTVKLPATPSEGRTISVVAKSIGVAGSIVVSGNGNNVNGSLTATLTALADQLYTYDGAGGWWSL